MKSNDRIDKTAFFTLNMEQQKKMHFKPETNYKVQEDNKYKAKEIVESRDHPHPEETRCTSRKFHSPY